MQSEIWRVVLSPSSDTFWPPVAQIPVLAVSSSIQSVAAVDVHGDVQPSPKPAFPRCHANAIRCGTRIHKTWNHQQNNTTKFSLKVREIKEIKEIKAKVVPTKKVPKICSKWCLVSFLQGLACTKGLAILRASHLFTSSVETLEPLREDMKGHGLMD